MTTDYFTGIEDVVYDDFRFKAKLGIGEDAYTSVKIRKAVFEAWDVAGVAATGAQVAGSAMVAQKFFAVPSILTSIGLGTATAATPLGWIIAASVVSGGAWFGITRYLKTSGGKTKVIPDFINTPIDALGLSLFDLIAPLGMKIAEVDGHVSDEEVATIKRYFVKDWGYSEEFTERGLQFIKSRLADVNFKGTAACLSSFARDNPDCNTDAMLTDIIAFLREIMEADGHIDEREEMAIERVERAFTEEMKFSLSRSVAPLTRAIKHLTGRSKAKPGKDGEG